MKNTSKILAVGAACAACCALPLAAPLLAGAIAAAPMAGFGAGWAAGLAGLATAALCGMLLLRRRRNGGTAVCASIDNGCGCAEVQPRVHQSAAPVACTLTPGDYKERIGWIQKLARDSLIHARREPLALHLSYHGEAAERVREMVSREEACCAFLRFDLHEDAQGIHLSIVAPEEAREAADELFAQFTSGLSNSGKQREQV